jgi:hypothetical protein
VELAAERIVQRFGLVHIRRRWAGVGLRKWRDERSLCQVATSESKEYIPSEQVHAATANATCQDL